jgi:hypothetical protein
MGEKIRILACDNTNRKKKALIIKDKPLQFEMVLQSAQNKVGKDRKKYNRMFIEESGIEIHSDEQLNIVVDTLSSIS